MSSDKIEGAMCGGVISESLFQSDPMAYMMAWVMPDDKFEAYKKLHDEGKREEANKLMHEHARSII